MSTQVVLGITYVIYLVSLIKFTVTYIFNDVRHCKLKLVFHKLIYSVVTIEFFDFPLVIGYICPFVIHNTQTTGTILIALY